MKIGLEPDPVEEMDRAIERAIATAARVQFGGPGDIGKALDEVQRLSRRRLDWTPQDMRVSA